MTKHEYQSLPRQLATGLARLEWRVRALAVLRGLGLLCAVAGAALATGLLIDWLVDVGVAARTALLVGAIATIFVTLAWTVVRPLFRRTTATELAALVDSAYPELGERIESAVELSDATLPERHRGSPYMRSLMLDQTVWQTETVDFGTAAESSSAVRWMGVGVLTLLLLLAPFGLSRDGYGLLLTRFLTPWENLERATNLYFHIENGDRAVPRGTDVTIVAEPRWRIAKTALPDSAWLQWHNGDGERDARRMEYDAESGTFRASIPHVLTSFDYDVSAGRTRTRSYHIDAVEAPSLQRMTLEISPPAYTGRPARRLDGPAGRIEAFERSRLDFVVEFSQPVVSAELRWIASETDEEAAADSSEEHDVIPFVLAEDAQSGRLTITADRSGPFSIEIRNERDVKNLEGEPWELAIVADEPPVIQWAEGDRALEQTGAAMEVRPGDRVPLPVIAADDIGVTELELHAEVVQRREKLEPLIAETVALGQTRVDHTFSWDLSTLTLKEGDLLAVRGRAVDGRPVPEPQEAWTSSRLIRITADAESVEKSLLAQQQQQLREILEAVRENVQQDRTETESLRKNARKAIDQPEPPDQQEQISNLAEREKKLTERLDQLAAIFAEHPLQQNMAEATREVGTGPLEAARQQFQQAASNPPQEQLEQLTGAADELDRADDQLERLLKRFDELAALEQDLQRLQQLAEDAEQLSNQVADFEQQWNELTGAQELADEERQDRSNELADQHEDLQSNQQALAGALDRLLEERPEVLQAATERQLERLQELGEQASRLAEREDRLADALEQEPSSAVDRPDQESPASAAGESSDESNEPPAPPEKQSPSNDTTEPPASETSTETDKPEEPTSPTTTPEDADNPAPSNDEEPTPPETSVAQRQERLAADAARMALETARSRGVEAQSAQEAREFAENSLQAAEEAQTGLLDDAAKSAKNAAEAARQTAEQMQNPTDPAPERLQSQAESLAEQQAALAEELRQQAESPTARQQAQTKGQQQLAEETAGLSEQLQQIAERLKAEPLDEGEEGERAGSAQTSAQNAQAKMQSAQQQLGQGQAREAAGHARGAAEALRETAQQAGQNAGENKGEKPGEKPADEPSPVPGEVGEQVADARQQLQQAGKQLSQNGPPQPQSQSPGENPGEQTPSDQTGPEQAAPQQADSPTESESPPRESPEPDNDQPMGETETPSDDQPTGEPQNSPTESADQNASQSMKQVAESLRQAARQLGMAPAGSDKNGKPGQQEGDPSEGTPGSQSGNSGKNPISLIELEAELKRMSSRNWGQLPGQVESELFQSTQRKPDADYARLIRLYFEEISRRRSAEEHLVPNDNEL